MASKRPFSEEDFTCPVCCDIFKDPVLLSCSHSVCDGCVRQYWNTEHSRKCPLCRKRSNANPPLNLALKNLCQTFLDVREDPGVLCDIHNEKLKLFCSNDGQLACVVCRESNKHLDHRFRPVDEAADEFKDIIKSALQPLKMKREALLNAQFNCSQKFDCIKQQAQYVKEQIKNEFKKLHKFLQNEQTSIMTELQEEVQLKTQMLAKKRKESSKEMLSLQKNINEIRRELESEDIEFIKRFEETLEKARCTEMDSDMVSGELIDVAKYLGNLQFRVWKKMENVIKYSPIILDPDTAHKQLILSDDLTSVRDSDDSDAETSTWRRDPPDTPERFHRCVCVLGSKSFYSGSHSWDVEVGDNTFWMLGVVTESGQKNERGIVPSGAWVIGCNDENLCARSPSEPCTILPVAAKPQVVRVHLDMSEGHLRFSDPSRHTVIHEFSHHFTEKVYPFFHSLCSLCPLKVLPLQPKVVLIRPGIGAFWPD